MALPYKVGLLGATGRMGIILQRYLDEHESFKVTGAIGRLGDMDALFQGCDIAIDFSHPDGLLKVLEQAIKYKRPLVIGTTGLTPLHEQALQEASTIIPLVYASNMSLGITLLKKYIREMARLLEAKDFDIEISEVHHRYKKDAPSGTALEWGKAAAQGRGVAFHEVACFPTRQGGRREGDIGFAVQRGGGQCLEHTLSFFGEEEMISFSHRGFSRSLYAKGALKAALWLLEKEEPGLYTMEEVLGL